MGPIEIKHHLIGDSSVDHLAIEADDEPGSGGAHHRYVIFNVDEPHVLQCEIDFQNGPVPQNGVNGVTIESLIAVGMHRLECFQGGPFPSPDNAEALVHLDKAMECLKRRSKERLARGVEGTLQV
jgi:hypothetical protein